MDGSKILTREEVQHVLFDLKVRAKRSINSRLNKIIFRLSCCCGLRVKEICGLDLGDVMAGGPRPGIRVRKDITKGREGKRRARLVPLWWDAGTLADIAAWLEYRRASGASKDDPFVCGHTKGCWGERLTEDRAAKRWRTAISVLGQERRMQLSIHCGRHSFCSHALGIGRSLAEVRDAAGHASISSTNIYLHFLEKTGVQDLFDFSNQ